MSNVGKRVMKQITIGADPVRCRGFKVPKGQMGVIQGLKSNGYVYQHVGPGGERSERFSITGRGHRWLIGCLPREERRFCLRQKKSDLGGGTKAPRANSANKQPQSIAGITAAKQQQINNA